MRQKPTTTTSSTQQDALERARSALASAERVLIGAGAGLSTAAGIAYSGERFVANFKPFITRYGMTDMYSAGFYPFRIEEDRWAYWAHHAWVNCLGLEATALYRKLHTWAREREHFVITTNADQQFEKAGFERRAIFATQGDYAHIQCARGCHEQIYPDRELFAAIEKDTGYGTRTRITDATLVPKCPVCAGPMAMHLRCDNTFVQTGDWYAAQERYQAFVAGIAEHPTVLLELGVGFNTPVWIRMPFERIAKAYGSTLIRMNYDDARVSGALPNAIGLTGDIAELWPQVVS